ncbi:glycosyltransferase family 2 protein [Flavobacterium sp. MEB061]|uniref:glycosyltransferase family 2 protein n=1 Tax=Flavobacterium sp. MEB061 TaxID=1587524 RepID=UPI000697ECE5|nr:glycosyltransferase family 2 protein [Flavobacterium sp. MEB061]
MKNPLISIITVSYNSEKYIEETIKSVLSQTYKNIEYIIIDGGSTDGTVAIIEKYSSKISYWISESDKGIYDAMNKGIKAATGDWVNFMNCGDWFFNNTTIELVFKDRKIDDYDVIYGNTEMRRENYEHNKIHVPSDKNNFWKKLVVHQSIFSRLKINQKYPFDLGFKVSADFDFIYKIFFFKHSVLYLNIIISSFDMIGYSHHHRYIGFSEDRHIALKYKGDFKISLKVYMHYLKVTFIGKLIDLLKKYSPVFYSRLKKSLGN